MKYKAYPEYKDSGIEWIGEIPKEWEVCPLKKLIYFQEGPGIMASDFRDSGVPLLRISSISGQFATLDGCNFLESNMVRSKWNHFRLNEGDLLISTSASMGIICEVNRDTEGAIAYTGIIRITPRNNISKDFLKHFIASDIFLSQIEVSKSGSTIQHYGPTHLKRMFAILPPVREQINIERFLNIQLERFNRIISIKEKLIDKLKEKRISIISHAVTKGIDSNAKMKPSGIDLIGDIPVGWEIKKLKYMVTKVGSGVTPSGGANVYQDEGVPFLRSQNIYSDRLKLDDIVYISEEIDEQMSNSRILEGDVLLNITGASIGRCFYVPTRFGCGNVNQHVCIIRPINSKVQTKYLQNIIISQYGQALIDVCQIGANREGLNFQQIKSFGLPLPSIEEQRLINEYLELEITRIDSIIAKAQTSIEKLKEYQTSLISATVTGKIDVRGESHD